MRPQGITHIIRVPNLGETPATVNRRNGILYISDKHWEQLKPEHRLFILLHEMAHIHLQSDDEFIVDEWAFNEYVKRGHSLKESVFALSKVLSGKNPQHYWRVYKQLERAQEADKQNTTTMAAYNGKPMLEGSIPVDQYFRNEEIINATRNIAGKSGIRYKTDNTLSDILIDQDSTLPKWLQYKQKDTNGSTFLYMYSGKPLNKEQIKKAYQLKKELRPIKNKIRQDIREAKKSIKQAARLTQSQIQQEANEARQRVKEWHRMNGVLPVPPEVLAGQPPYKVSTPPVAYMSNIRGRVSRTLGAQ